MSFIRFHAHIDDFCAIFFSFIFFHIFFSSFIIIICCLLFFVVRCTCCCRQKCGLNSVLHVFTRNLLELNKFVCLSDGSDVYMNPPCSCCFPCREILDILGSSLSLCPKLKVRLIEFFPCSFCFKLVVIFF